MDPQEMKTLPERFYNEVINGKNLSAVDEFCAPNFRDHDPANPTGDLQGMKQSLKGYFSAFPDLHVTIDDVVAEGDKVVVRLTLRGTQRGELQGIPATNRQVEIQAIDIVHVVNGKADEHWSVFDQLGMLQQLGVIQAPGQPQRRAA